MTMRHGFGVLTIAVLSIAACATASARSRSGIRVGPPAGSVVVVGGGGMGPEIIKRFIELAGGPDAPLVMVPTASGAASYSQNDGGARQFRAAGAKNVIVLHTTARAVANADSFVAPIRNARGVWFGGGRHYRLVDSYSGTKTEAAFHDVLARGGVVGGSSAGASILASFLVRGAPSNDNRIMAHPQYLAGFGFLSGVAIDQHVVARSRLADLADSIMPRYRDLLGISEDEGTAWVVRGDTGEVIGRGKAFVYGGRDPNDAGKPFLTVLPGDRYDLGARRVLRRAIADSRLTRAFVDSLFAGLGDAKATVLVARDGDVLLNASYNVPPQSRYQPETTTPNFALGGISDAMLAMVVEPSPANAQRMIIGRAGMAHTRFDTAKKTFASNVDNLYRWERLLTADDDSASRAIVKAYGMPDGKRNAFVRDVRFKAVVIILSDSDALDAQLIADRIMRRVLEIPLD